ncbi:MAG TPA: enoyl-CoA hydratase-related protein [Frankiaceae bacterium]|nr:enoyl-CoA hydratase-related protein [Frankiaceae bacterium]
MAQLDRDGEVFVLDLGTDENRFNPTSVAELTKLLDEVEAANAPRALVLAASGKFWSNGLDLEWMAANQDQILSHVDAVHALLARVLALPVPTVAAIQGHCFAAGAMLALAADFRVMRDDRGFFCLPEVDIHIPFTPGMAALIQARLSKKTAHEAMTTGRRYGGKDALAAGIVDAVGGENEVRSTALDLVRPLAAKDGPTLGAIKRGMYGPAIAALQIPQTTGLG